MTFTRIEAKCPIYGPGSQHPSKGTLILEEDGTITIEVNHPEVARQVFELLRVNDLSAIEWGLRMTPATPVQMTDQVKLAEDVMLEDTPEKHEQFHPGHVTAVSETDGFYCENCEWKAVPDAGQPS